MVSALRETRCEPWRCHQSR
jgi:class 3 adenylate cyclase